MSKHYKLRINVIENNFQVALDKIFELRGIGPDAEDITVSSK